MDGGVVTSPEPDGLEPQWDMSGSVAPPGMASAPDLAPAPVATAPEPTRGPAGIARPLSAPRRPEGFGLVAVIVIGVLIAGIAAMFAFGGGSLGERALARSINLHLSDLPGYAILPAQQQTIHAGPGAAAALSGQCANLDGAPHPGLVDVSSPMFQLGSGLAVESVGSDVAIEPSRRLAAADLGRVTNARDALRCVSTSMSGASVAQNGITVTFAHARVTRLSLAALGADGRFGIRVAVPILVNGISVRMVMDIEGYVVGRDELTLATYAVDHPFPAVQEQQLAALMIGRARANPH